MKAAIRRFHSPDIQDLAAYQPVDQEDFAFLLQVMIGPEGGDGEESFDIAVCSPKWLLNAHGEHGVVIGRHHLIMMRYDFSRMKEAVHGFCQHLSADTWEELATKLGRLGKWEFEDYVGNPEPPSA